MKQHPLEQLHAIAEIVQVCPRRVMSRNDRLERWAELLERSPYRPLSTLHQTEHRFATERAGMRSEGSPISVAFEDAVLRAAGLENDTYGEAMRFFDLTDGQLHRIICFCHFGSTVTGAAAAVPLRRILARQRILGWLREMFSR